MRISLICNKKPTHARKGEEERTVPLSSEAALSNVSVVTADPLYAPVCPHDARLIPLPHQAFSDRNGWKDAVEFTSLDPEILFS